MTDDELAALILIGHETPGIECKGSGRRDDSHLFAKVTRAALGMSNRRDGGEILIGVADSGHDLTVIGLSAEELATWTHDLIADGFRSYAEPGVSFTREVRLYEGKTIVVLRIQQFNQTPVICTGNYQAQGSRDYVLRAGTVYVRDSTKAATLAVTTHAQLRELVDLAAEWRLRDFLRTARAAGVELAPPAAEDDSARFRVQRLPYANVADKIMTRGGWITVVHPVQFDATRIDLNALLPLLQRTVVKLRGWDFPHLDPASEPAIAVDHIEQFTEWQHHLEWWRFYQSGQLVDVRGFNNDWRDQSSLWPPNIGWKHGEVLDVIEAVLQLTEIFEATSRLAANLPGVDDLQVSIIGFGLRGRLLSTGDSALTPFSTPKIASVADLTYEVVLPRQDILADPRGAAVKAAGWFFDRFGWNAGAPTLQRMQERLPR